MKIIKFLIPLLFLAACNIEQGPKYYLFETSEYCDFDDSLRVIYVKSHRQLIKDTTFYVIVKCDPGPCYRVYNALGQEFSTNNIYHERYPKITINTLDQTYDITIHSHPGNDSTLVINSSIELPGLSIIRYYMIEELKFDSIRSVFQFLDPLSMTKSIEVDGDMYTVGLENYTDIDYERGERVILEYDTYKIPIPYQIFKL